MPAYEITSRFAAGLGRLSAEQRRRFSQAVAAFVDDLRTGAFRPGLRVKGVRRAPEVFELTWEGNGRISTVRLVASHSR